MDANDPGFDMAAPPPAGLRMREQAGFRPPWRAWFGKRTPRPQERAATRAADGLGFRRDYETLAREGLERYGIDPSTYYTEAVVLGATAGKQVHAVLICGLTEDAATAMQLQLLAPLIERRIRETVQARWIGDHTAFAGVWTRWPSQVRQPEELRSVMATLRKGRDGGDAAALRSAAAGEVA